MTVAFVRINRMPVRRLCLASRMAIKLNGNSLKVSPRSENLENLKKESAALFDQGRLEESAAVMERVILILENPKTADAEQLIDSLEKLGALYFGLQDYAKTVSVYSRLVVALDKKVGMEHVDTIKAVYKLAKSCEKAGQREQAQTMYYIAKESALKTLPEENYLRQSITGSYQIISKPKRVTESVNTFVVGDLHNPDELVKAAKSIPQKLKKLSVRGDIFLSILCSLLLVIGSGVWITSEIAKKKQSQATQDKEIPSVHVRDPRTVSSANSYATTDGMVQLRFFNDNEAELECENSIIKMPVVRLTESLDSIMKIYDAGLVGNRIWAETAGSGIRTDGDLRFFSSESFELKLAEACKSVAQTLNDYYKKNGSYPDSKSELIAAGRLTYVNPYTGKPQSVSYQNFSQFMQLDYIFDGVKTMEEAGNFLRAGGRWNDEPAFVPGGINAISRYSGEKLGDNFVVPIVFMHPADKERQLLPAARTGTTLVYELKKGEFANDSVRRLEIRDFVLNQFQGKTLYLVTSQGLFANIWLWKNLTTVAISMALLASITWWFIFDARARLKDPKKALKVSEVIVAITLVSFFGWIVLAAVMKI